MNPDRDDDILARMRRGHPESLICNPDTDLVIEGYPRSGNTFMHDMIAVLCEGRRRLKIAHHTHAADNLRLASRYGVPGCVLIREPEDAILSYHIYSANDVEECARRYVAFYESVPALTGPRVVAGFDEVVGDFGPVLAKLNSILARPLPVPADLEAAAAKALKRAAERAEQTHGESAGRKGGVPNPEREKVKEALRGRVRDFLERTQEIDRLYRRVVELGA